MRLFNTIWFSCLLVALLEGCGSYPRLGKTHPYLSQTTSPAPTQPPVPVLDSVQTEILRDSLFFSAEGFLMVGAYPEAIADFNRYLVLDPHNATVFFELSRIFSRLRNPDMALKDAREAVRLDPSNKWFNLGLADILVAGNHGHQAVEIFRQLHRQNPQNPDYLYNLGVLLANNKDYSGALQAFDSLEQMIGVNEELTFQLQRLYLKLGEVDQAAREIRKLIAKNPEEHRYDLLLAEVYSANNMEDKAFKVDQDLLKKDPENPQALVAEALYYKKRGEDSLYHSTMALAFTNPKLPLKDKIEFVAPYLKYVEIDTSKIREALLLCRMILKASPHSGSAHALLGDMFFRSAMPDSALSQYKISAALNNTVPEVWQQILILYAADQQNDSLMKVSAQVIHLFPKDFMGYYFLGAAQVYLHLDSAGMANLKLALKKGVADQEVKAQIYSLLGEAYQASGNYPDADQSFDHSLLLNPDNDEVLNNYSYYLSQRNQHLEKAEQMSKKSLVLQPDNYVYEDTYARILFRLGKYREARVWMEKALQNPKARVSPGYLEHEGDILFQLHHPNQALKYWQLAQNYGGHSAELLKKIKEKKLEK
ncbi:MAG: tetratricopeptide repeat protein [Chitinophagaceae bacterium]